MNPYILITIIVFITVFILMITWTNVVQEPTKFPPPIQITQAGYGSRCVNDPTLIDSSNPNDINVLNRCADGLTCVFYNVNDTYGFCRKSEGSSCTTVVECVPTMKMCFEGICASTTTGGLNQPPPCISPLVDVDGICKYPEGHECTSTEQCSVGQCVAPNPNIPSVRICRIGKVNGSDCIFNEDCTSLYCDESSGNGYCQPFGIQTGSLGAACFYYKATSEPTICGNDTNCNLVFPPANAGNIGECLTNVLEWPSNTLDEQCLSGEACLPPSICYQGICIMPIPDPLSCAEGISSGLCTAGFTCVDNFRCIPTTGLPGISTAPASGTADAVWSIFQWNKSINSNMGFWTKFSNIDTPAEGACISSIITSTNEIMLYSSDPLSHTTTSFNYDLFIDNIHSVAILNFVRPSDWSPSDILLITPYQIKFFLTDTGGKVALLINLVFGTNSCYYIVIADLPTIDILSFLLPTKAVVNSILPGNRTSNVLNFDIDLRDIGRVLYRVGTQIFVSSPSNTLPAFPLTLSGFFLLPNTGTKVTWTSEISGLNNTTYYDELLTNDTLLLSPSGDIIGNPIVRDFAISTKFVISATKEILYIENNRMHYLYGLNDVVMPVDVSTTGFPLVDVTVLDTTLNGSHVNTKLYLISTST